MHHAQLRIRSWEPSKVTGVPDLLTAKDLEAILKIDVKTIYSYERCRGKASVDI